MNMKFAIIILAVFLQVANCGKVWKTVGKGLKATGKGGLKAGKLVVEHHEEIVDFMKAAAELIVKYYHLSFYFIE